MLPKQSSSQTNNHKIQDQFIKQKIKQLKHSQTKTASKLNELQQPKKHHTQTSKTTKAKQETKSRISNQQQIKTQHQQSTKPEQQRKRNSASNPNKID